MAGMVGATLFRRYVTCIDFSHHVIELTDSARFDPRRAGAPLRMSIKDSEITIRGRFDGALGIFQLDTGSPTTLTLTAPFVARHHLLSNFSKRVETSSSGVGGSTQAFTVRGRTLVLGSVQIDNPITELSVSSKGQFARGDLDGNIGIGALKRYIVTFDFPGERLFLKPCQPAPADLDTYDRSGLRIELEPAGFRVVSVAKGTPAAEAGLHPGDVIVAVDGQAATRITLPTMRGRLRERPAGSVVTLGIKSDDKVRSVRLTLRDLL
jgi:membrane-associated protease RseP (regulator of RpoE activity)